MDRRIIAYWFNPLFIVLIAIAIMTDLAQNKGSGYEIWRMYGMNILAMPVYLYVGEGLMKVMTRKETYSISIIDRILIFIGISIIFEWVLPFFSAKYISDPIDILCYALGTFLLFPVLNKTQLFHPFERLYLKIRSNAAR